MINLPCPFWVKAYIQDPMKFNLYDPDSLLQAQFFVNGVFLCFVGMKSITICNSFGAYEAGHIEFVWAMTENLIAMNNTRGFWVF